MKTSTRKWRGRIAAVLLTLALLAGMPLLGVLPASADAPGAENILTISGMDDTTGWQLGSGTGSGGSLEETLVKVGAAALRSYTEGAVNTYITNTGLNIPMPADWQNWYADMWIYLEKGVTFGSGSCLELSETVDHMEVAFDLSGLSLQQGWNKIRRKLDTGAKTLQVSDGGSDWTAGTAADFHTLKNVRIWTRAHTDAYFIVADNLSLVKESELNAHDLTVLSTRLTEANGLNTSGAGADNLARLNKAKAQAQEVKDAATASAAAYSQADVNAVVAYLEDAMSKIDYNPHNAEPFIRPTGRNYYEQNELKLFWTNSGFSFSFTGTGATAVFTSTASGNVTVGTESRPRVSHLNVYVDGALTPTKVIPLTTGVNNCVLAEDLPAGAHTIRVAKRNQANFGTRDVVGVREIQLAGEGAAWNTAPAAPARQIEFIGDSITCGQGNLLFNENGASPYAEEGTMTYAALTSAAFGAANHTMSQSGIRFVRAGLSEGLCVDKDGNPDTNVNSVITNYTKTATLPNTAGSSAEWSFARPSDVVVINLGTNDNGVNRASTRTDAELAAYIQAEAKVLLDLVRGKNPDAVIIWTYGMMGESSKISTPVKAAIQAMADAGDNKVFYLSLSDSVAALEGRGDGHPTVAGNINRSYALTQFIAGKTGWDYSLQPQLAAKLYSLPEPLEAPAADMTDSQKAYGMAHDYAEVLRTPANVPEQDAQVPAATQLAQAAWVALAAPGASASDKAALVEALTLDERRYTAASTGTAHYVAAKAAASAVAAWTNAPQQLVKYAAEALLAEQALLVRGVITDELEELLAGLDAYEPFFIRGFLTGDAYKNAKKAAQDILEKADATQNEVNLVYGALFDLTSGTNHLAKPGDVSRDGAVDSTDARLVLQAEVALIELEEAQQFLGDVSGDWVGAAEPAYTVDSTDARLILQKEVELITKFPVETKTADMGPLIWAHYRPSDR